MNIMKKNEIFNGIIMLLLAFAAIIMFDYVSNIDISSSVEGMSNNNCVLQTSASLQKMAIFIRNLLKILMLVILKIKKILMIVSK